MSPDVRASYSNRAAEYAAQLGSMTMVHSADVIHHEPIALRHALDEFARALRPGGRLLIGFFVGPDVEAFDHAIVTAYRWSPDALDTELREAGFDVIETHTRTGSQVKPRPHGVILAKLRN